MKRSSKVIMITIGFILFFVSAFILFEPNNDPTGFFIYTPTLAVINYENNEPLYGNLDILFITSRTNDLIINTLDGDMEIIRLKCGNNILNPNSNIFKNYKCRENSILSIKVLSKKLDLELQFGNTRQKVTNIA